MLLQHTGERYAAGSEFSGANLAKCRNCVSKQANKGHIGNEREEKAPQINDL